MMITLDQTRALMMQAHSQQTDKAGFPYHEHPERVLQRLLDRFPDASLAERHASLLHDVVEDTRGADAPITFELLTKLGYDAETLDILRLVTRDPDDGLSYIDWIRAIVSSGNVGAMRVKWADNRDNADPLRIALLPPEQRGIASRYDRAKVILENGLGFVGAATRRQPAP